MRRHLIIIIIIIYEIYIAPYITCKKVTLRAFTVTAELNIYRECMYDLNKCHGLDNVHTLGN